MPSSVRDVLRERVADGEGVTHGVSVRRVSVSEFDGVLLLRVLLAVHHRDIDTVGAVLDRSELIERVWIV